MRKLNAKLSELGISAKIIDVLASRINNQFPSYVAYRPNRTLLLAGCKITPFPPVAIIVHKVLDKIVHI